MQEASQSDTPSEATPFTTFYQPTPLEQAYSRYILQVVLQQQQETSNHPFHLSGRVAVPFLSSSGVDRVTLRSIWTAVDPLGEGSLTTVIQFTSLLKLVSLAQQKWLDLSQTQGQLVHRLNVPLASFANVIIPQHDYLLSTFMVETTTAPIASIATAASTSSMLMLNTKPVQSLSVTDAFGDIGVADAPIPSLPTGQREEEDEFGDFTDVPSPPVAADDDDDFGDFEQVNDYNNAPVLGTTNTADGSEFQQPTTPTVDGAHVLPTAVLPTDGIATYNSNAPISVDIVGGQPSTTTGLVISNSEPPNLTQPTPPGLLDGGVQAGALNQPDLGSPPTDDDDFGDFAEHAVVTNDNMTGTFDNLQQQAVVDQQPPLPGMHSDFGEAAQNAPLDAFDGLQSSNDQPLPPLMGTTLAGGSNDDLHGFEASTIVQGSIDGLQPALDQPLPHLGMPEASNSDFGAIEEPATVPSMGVFDGLQPALDQPLPSLGNPVVSHDNFGDFETPAMAGPLGVGALQPALDQPLPSLENPVVSHDDFGDFETPAMAAPLGVGALQPALDQPLSSLENPIVSHDDFGEAPAMAAPLGVGALQPALDQPLSSLENPIVSHDDFGESPAMAAPLGVGALQPALDQPLSSLGDLVVSHETCGDFEAPAVAAPSDMMAGAFDALQSVVDKPLPPLGTPDAGDVDGFSATAKVADQALPTFHNPAGSEDDDFGGFEACNAQPRTDMVSGAVGGQQQTPPLDNVSTAFDAIQPAMDQPLSSLGPPVVEAPDDFGDFAGSGESALPGSTSTMHIPVYPDASQVSDYPSDIAVGSSPFDLLQTMQEAPLPPLCAPSPAPPADDSFGDFDEAPAENLPSSELPPVAQTDDSFGAFKAHGTEENPPVMPPPVPPTDDSFGDFEQPMEASPIVPTDDSFGEFEDPTGVDASVLAPAQNEHLSATGALPISNPPNHSFLDVEAPGTVHASAPFDAFGPALDKALPVLDVPKPHHPPPDDVFGAFGGTHAPVPSVEAQQTNAEQDPFSMFDNPGQAVPTASPLAMIGTTSTGIDSVEAVDIPDTAGSAEEDNDDFGDFETPNQKGAFILPNNPPVHDFVGAVDIPGEAGNTKDNDNFSDFGGFETSQQQGTINPLNDAPAAPEDDDFGDFATPEIVPDQPLVSDGEFGQTAQTQHTENANDDLGDFSGFAFGTGEIGQGPSLQDSDPQAIQFGAFDTPKIALEPVGSGTDDDEDDFAEFTEAKQQQQDNDDWGDFEHVEVPRTEHSTATEANVAAAPAPRDNFSFTPRRSFDSFDSMTSSSPETLIEIETEIRASSSKLPKSFTKLNFVLLLERNSKSKGTKTRSKRCLKLVSTLCARPSITENWNRLLLCIRDELTMGTFLLKEAKKLSKSVFKEVKKSLITMVSGLLECVRVERSIVATIADLLCLAYNTIMSRNDLRELWFSLEWIALALEIEDLWRSLEECYKSLRVRPTSQLESLATIRTPTKAARKSVAKAPLCHLTLQPVLLTESKYVTKSQVDWEDNKVMACAANLWANRVSTTVP